MHVIDYYYKVKIFNITLINYHVIAMYARIKANAASLLMNLNSSEI